jgi:hypothetical protein
LQTIEEITLKLWRRSVNRNSCLKIDLVANRSIHGDGHCLLWNAIDVNGASNLFHEISIALGTPAHSAHAGKPATAPAGRL